MLPKIISPSEVLTQKSKPVDRIDASVKKLLAEMKETLDTTRDPEGVGLAAPQVGKSLRIFLIKPTQKDKAEVFINPEIISRLKSENHFEFFLLNPHKRIRQKFLSILKL
ncbi:MAG: peptide deformylase [Candidatus Levybacteria bacterium]|nr:peptide deformylase [Candidatus Levybacteria bacterium]